MSQLIIDEAWTKSDPAALKRAGYVGLMGYLSHTPSKNLTPSYISAAHAAGLGVGFVFEDSAERALAGRAGGVADAAFANLQADAMGVPDNIPIYYAVDFGVTSGQLPVVLEYLLGASTGKRKARGYGSASLIDYLFDHGVPEGWQTSAWSGTAVSSHAALYQRLHPTLPTVPGSYDEDVELDADPGLWMPAGVPAPVKPPVPAYPGSPLRLTAPPLHSPSVAIWQAQMTRKGFPLTSDGVYGPQSARMCHNFQLAHKLTADSIVGPATWAAVFS